MAPEAFFLPAASGQRFCLLHRPDPQVGLKGEIVYIHPFAEEMNKARRMAALQARAMAAAGYAVLQIDLQGCGDSSGDFGEATWAGWVEDVVSACAWLRQRYSSGLWLWGLRSGCLLAGEAARQVDDVSRLLFWQPVLSGRQYLQHFLRLKAAAEMLAGAGKGLMDALRAELAQGRPVEIAGYTLSPALAHGLEKCGLELPERPMRVEWIELSARADASLSPAAMSRLETWNARGHAARSTVVSGPAFWQTTEIAECPALLDASLAAMMNPGRS